MNRYKRQEQSCQLLELFSERLERRQMLSGDVSARIDGNRNLVVNGDGDDNAIVISFSHQGDVTITGLNGTNVDSGNLATSRVSGDVRINLRGGNDTVTVNGSSATDYGPVQSLQIFTGSGNDDVAITNFYGISALTAKLGAGTDTMDVDDVGVFGDFVVVTGAGDSEISLTEVKAIGQGNQGNLVISSSSGDDDLELDRVFSSKDIRIRAGGGDNRVELHAAYSRYGDFEITVGGGNDVINIDDSRTTSVLPVEPGDVSIKSGGGDDELRINELSTSTLSINTGGGNDDVKLFESTMDEFRGALAGGDDQLSFFVPNSVTIGPLWIHGGGGNDVVVNVDLVDAPVMPTLRSVEALVS